MDQLADFTTTHGNVCRFIHHDPNWVECQWGDAAPSRDEMIEVELYVRSGGVTERCEETCGEMRCTRLVGHDGPHGHEIEPGLILAPFPGKEARP